MLRASTSDVRTASAYTRDRQIMYERHIHSPGSYTGILLCP